ncbi:transcription initiation factor TFIID subunit 5-like [Cryptotermes secundus]|uniref:transcription initiation factor TFIID subunit 5-like n=1 Tax=Cryptotermes secundus TaxID=105785 RepID=UPI001454CAEC|nr:transcription initiation factor TFIID subunit 5-like [Cryptotermes secundus]
MLPQAPVYSLCFSVEGRFLASAGADSRVLLWDLAHGHLLAELTGHKGPIHTLAFSRDGHILTSGSQDCSVKLWDFSRLAEEMVLEDVDVSHNPDIKNSGSYSLRSYGTKNSAGLHLHLTRRNVLLTVGIYEGS